MKLHEVINAWKLAPAYAGVRVADLGEIGFFDAETQYKIEVIMEALEWLQLIIFRYSGFDRVVAPFVVGVSTAGNALMRGYRLEGLSRSGKGAGWRVFQVGNMENVENHQDYFEFEDFDFVEFYPWIYRVFKML